MKKKVWVISWGAVVTLLLFGSFDLTQRNHWICCSSDSKPSDQPRTRFRTMWTDPSQRSSESCAADREMASVGLGALGAKPEACLGVLWLQVRSIKWTTTWKRFKRREKTKKKALVAKKKIHIFQLVKDLSKIPYTFVPYLGLQEQICKMKDLVRYIYKYIILLIFKNITL